MRSARMIARSENQKMSPMMSVGVTENTAFPQKSPITVVVYARLLDEREQDCFANSEARDGHQKTVDSHSHAAARWHSVFKGS